MNATRSGKRVGTHLFLLALLLAMPICAQARMRCVTGSQGIAGQNALRTTDLIGERYRFDVVPCVDEKDRSNADNESRIRSGEEAASSIAWIVSKTGWTSQEAPRIRFIPHAELVNIFSGGKRTDYHVESLYSDQNHTIYLPDSWRGDNLRDRSILLHEVVHHLQYLNNVKFTCVGEYEWQAVELQFAWLKEQGVDAPLDLLGINSLFLLMLRQCE